LKAYVQYGGVYARFGNMTSGEDIRLLDNGGLQHRYSNGVIGNILDSGNFIAGTDYASPTLESRRYVGATGQPAFQNGWVNYGDTFQPAAFYKDNQGIVHFEGMLKSGTIGTVIFTLPTGYIPARYKYFCCATNNGSGSVIGEIVVYPNGEVHVTVGATNYVSLDGISFRI
jgi:hypothetical protein